jgi:hypothetical protein
VILSVNVEFPPSVDDGARADTVSDIVDVNELLSVVIVVVVVADVVAGRLVLLLVPVVVWLAETSRIIHSIVEGGTLGIVTLCQPRFFFLVFRKETVR